ncbi:MAG TPA: phosphate acyltransferase PlsX [Candidatus Bathyarchaeia archaeon]|nr:phosphate acyltransferase PlsX [Candidatus Bathyarchaeia archaeon]
MPRIAVDAMGGDFAPEETVRAVAQVSLESDIEIVLVGNADRIQALLDGGPYNPELISVRHCSSAIGMAEDPRDALRAKRDASITVAARMVAAGEADAMVSAGNTGACVLAAAKHFKLIKGVRKAALASVFPRHTEYAGQDVLALLLDVGATIRCDALELAQFAVMGSAYARRISKIPSPRVGLLNMGAEETKGGEVLIDANRRLRGLPQIDFIGNVEGNDVATGKADVIVTEGLVGNIVLKLIEGIGEVAMDIASQAARESWRYRLGLLMLSTGIARMRELADYRTYGGAPVLGFENLCIKAHGRSNAPAVRNAIKVAAKAVRDRITADIAEAVAQIR